MTKKNDKKYGSASGKMQFLQPAKLSFFLVIFLMQFLSEKLEKDNVSRKMQFLQPAKITKNTNKTADQNSNSNDKNDNQNDRQTWNDKNDKQMKDKTEITKKWQQKRQMTN